MNFTEENDVRKECEELCESAIKMSRVFGKEFNYSGESIKRLEDILKYYHECVERKLVNEEQIASIALIFGAYLGETMLRNKLAECGFQWQYEEEVPIVKHKAEDWTARPVSKVYKRLVNGEEDSVVSFYDIVIDYLINGEI